MLKIDYEFRKGIFFIRFIDDMNKNISLANGKEIKLLLRENKFKYIVVNVNYLEKINNDIINYLLDIYDMTKKEQGYLVLCDRFRLLNKFKVPRIDSELEVL